MFHYFKLAKMIAFRTLSPQQQEQKEQLLRDIELQQHTFKKKKPSLSLNSIIKGDLWAQCGVHRPKPSSSWCLTGMMHQMNRRIIHTFYSHHILFSMHWAISLKMHLFFTEYIRNISLLIVVVLVVGSTRKDQVSSGNCDARGVKEHNDEVSKR